MAEINQFGSAKPVRSGIGTSCAQCEAMLTDATDGTLSAADQAAFDRHIETCDVCSQMLAEAQRGAALLSMLKRYRPEPATSLLDRILAQTSGAAGVAESHGSTQAAGSALSIVSGANAGGLQAAFDSATGVGALASPISGGLGSSVAFNGPGKVLPFSSRLSKGFNLKSIGHAMLQPRLAMTAAMAFFSVALTLNLTGVRLNELRANDLKPANLKRSIYEGGAHVVRYYDNLRVVYELESRVHDMQRASDSDTPASAEPKTTPDSAAPGGDSTDKQKQSRPKPGSGTSERRNQNLFHSGYKLVLLEDRASHFIPRSSALPSASVELSLKNDLVVNGSITNKFKDLEPEGGLV